MLEVPGLVLQYDETYPPRRKFYRGTSATRARKKLEVINPLTHLLRDESPLMGIFEAICFFRGMTCTLKTAWAWVSHERQGTLATLDKRFNL